MNQHLDGIPWWEAPPPPRQHEHWAQTTGMLSEFEQVRRCPCGAIYSNLAPRWVLLDPPRVAPAEPSDEHSEVRRFLSDRLDADQVAADEGLSRRPRFLRLRVLARHLGWGHR